MIKKISPKEVEELEWLIGPWEVKVWKTVLKGIYDFRSHEVKSGFLDAHCHICRAYTYDKEFMPTGVTLNRLADEPLKKKQKLVGKLHKGKAYTKSSLRERMEKQIERAIKAGTREMWAITDTTSDIGMIALDTLLELKEKHAKQIEIKAGCYPVFGFKNTLLKRDRLDVLVEAAKKADFIVGLPEKDEKETRIGFKRHVAILLDLGFKEKKEVHIHADQSNSAYSEDTFRIIECLESLLPEEFAWYTQAGRPKLWVVHLISPSSYNPKKFSKLVELLSKYNIGVIICPRAALSMRELRTENAPIHNSVARILELIVSGVKISFGTDNINDIFVPSGKGTIISELDILWDTIRNYSCDIMAKIAIGIEPDDADIADLETALSEKRSISQNHAESIKNKEKEKSKFDF